MAFKWEWHIKKYIKNLSEYWRRVSYTHVTNDVQ